LQKSELIPSQQFIFSTAEKKTCFYSAVQTRSVSAGDAKCVLQRFFEAIVGWMASVSVGVLWRAPCWEVKRNGYASALKWWHPSRERGHRPSHAWTVTFYNCRALLWVCGYSFRSCRILDSPLPGLKSIWLYHAMLSAILASTG